MSREHRHKTRAFHIALNNRKDKTGGLDSVAKSKERRKRDKEQSLTVDLHKLQLSDALSYLDLEINQRFMRGEKELTVITGMGKVLQPEIKSFLSNHPLVTGIKSNQENPGRIKVTLEDVK